MPDTVLPEPLLHAYRSTHYRIQGQNWYLQIGEPQPALRPYYQRHAVQSAVYLTACNPLGELLPDEHNARRMEQLRQALQRLQEPALRTQSWKALALLAEQREDHAAAAHAWREAALQQTA